MPRVLGIDPGTLSLDICSLEDGVVVLERSLPTREALTDPAVLRRVVDEAGPLDLIAGPSGYGLPLVYGRDLTEADVRLACLAPPGESGGIGGLGAVMRALAHVDVPVVFTPGVLHLASVPDHRKVNRVDMGTADKVCAAALAIHDQATRRACAPSDVSFILLELGGAFTAALAVESGRIVDGLGGSSGPIGMSAAGALDGEVAFLAGTISKALLFRGGVRDIAHGEITELALQAYIEGAAKAVAALRVSAPAATDILLSGRMGSDPRIRHALSVRFGSNGGADLHGPPQVVNGLTPTVKHAAQGAALIADGLAGGRSRVLVETLGLRDARGTVLDHLHVIDRKTAAHRIGLT